MSLWPPCGWLGLGKQITVTVWLGCCAADLRGQSAQAARLGEQLARGPLAEVAASLSPLLTVVTEGTQVRDE
jgi:hypothetical protein